MPVGSHLLVLAQKSSRLMMVVPETVGPPGSLPGLGKIPDQKSKKDRSNSNDEAPLRPIEVPNSGKDTEHPSSSKSDAHNSVFRVVRVSLDR